ncbi:MAG TPA: tetratricopeptide repeat protein [Terriglobales bacterium]|nr:tetratricopeptide repeat protein [Terriglobales bacterium]
MIPGISPARLKPAHQTGASLVTWLLLAACVALPSTRTDAQQQPAPDRSPARSHFSSAQKALAAGDSVTAVEELQQAIQADPKFAEAYLLLGLTEFRRGETEKSIQHYQQSLKLEPHSYSGRYNLALAYLREHRLEDGRAQLEQAVKLDPIQADAAYDLGIVLLEQGKPSAALTHLTRARRLNPRRPDVAFNIVRAELEAGHVSEARIEAQTAAQHFGQDFQWSAAVGQLFLKNAAPGDAAVYLHTASLIRPDDLEIRRQLALAYLASGGTKQVLDAISDPKTSDDHYLRGSAYYLDHRFAEADRESEQALTLAPDNPQALVLRTRVLQRAGEQGAALELARKAAALAPNWDEPFYLAGISLYFIRRYSEAGENLARAAELNPKSARALFLEAAALVNQGKHDEAERCLRRAIALQPKNARFHCHLGILLVRENRDAEAEPSFRSAIALAPNYALPHYELGKVLVRSKQWSAAAQELQQAVNHDPNLSAAYYQLARVYAKLGKTEKSERMLADFEKLYQKQTNDSQTQDDDARKETESPDSP